MFGVGSENNTSLRRERAMGYLGIRWVLLSTIAFGAIATGAKAQESSSTPDDTATTQLDPTASDPQDQQEPHPAPVPVVPEPESVHGEIVVTARKQAESLMDVPVTVSVISGGELQRQGIADLNRIAQEVPQLTVAKADSGTGASFNIRGIGSSILDPGVEQSVSVALDGVQITRGHLIFFGMFDIEQVEVLKGPQALFFGKNSPAGVIAIRTAGPTNSLSGYVTAGYEIEAREKYAEGAISGPLTDTLSARLAVRGSTMRGWLRNVSQPLSPAENPFLPTGSPGAAHKYLPGSEELLGRLTLRWEPSADFDATLKVSGGLYQDNGTSSQAYCPDGTAPAHNFGVLRLDPFQTCEFDDRAASTALDPSLIHPDWPDVREDGKPYTDLSIGLASLLMNYRLGPVELSSVTGLATIDYQQSNDYSFTSFGSLFLGIHENTESLTQEVRAITDFALPVNFTFGAYYDHIVRDNGTATMIFYAGPDPVTGKNHSFEVVGTNTGETISAFGQARWNITPAVELAGGLRWTHETREQTAVNNYLHGIVGPLFGFVPVGNEFVGRVADTDFSPEVTLSWKPNEDSLIFGAYKTGYKSGGFSTPVLFLRDPFTGELPDQEKLAFGPEEAAGFEGGIKTLVGDRRLRLQLTGYRYKYTGLQLSIFDAQTFSYFVRNAADARVEGAEFSADWRPFSGFGLRGDLAYNRAKYLRFENAPCYTNQPTSTTSQPGFCKLPEFSQDLTGETLPRAPRWTFGLSSYYDMPVGPGLSLGVNAGVTYKDDYITMEDNNPIAVQDGFALLNAGAHLYTDDERYEIALIGRNLTDERFIEYSVNKSFGKPTGDYQAATPRGREIRLQARYRF